MTRGNSSANRYCSCGCGYDIDSLSVDERRCIVSKCQVNHCGLRILSSCTRGCSCRRLCYCLVCNGKVCASANIMKPCNKCNQNKIDSKHFLSGDTCICRKEQLVNSGKYDDLVRRLKNAGAGGDGGGEYTSTAIEDENYKVSRVRRNKTVIEDDDGSDTVNLNAHHNDVGTETQPTPKSSRKGGASTQPTPSHKEGISTQPTPKPSHKEEASTQPASEQESEQGIVHINGTGFDLESVLRKRSAMLDQMISQSSDTNSNHYKFYGNQIIQDELPWLKQTMMFARKAENYYRRTDNEWRRAADDLQSLTRSMTVFGTFLLQTEKEHEIISK